MKHIAGLIALFIVLPTMASAYIADTLRTYGSAKDAVVYVFSSPSCPHCAAFHQDILPDLKKQLADSGLAQIKLVEVPGDKRSLKAIQLAKCMPTIQSYEKYMASVFQNQPYWLFGKDPDEMLRGYATLAGLDKKKQDACLADTSSAEKFLEQVAQLSQLYHIEALPTTVVVKNGESKSFVGADPRILEEIRKVLRP